ncbi:MAG TPA: DUF2845 domain-containing protein [Steroidobacteraceae bacterium]
MDNQSISVWRMKTLSAFAILACLPSILMAEGIRCGSRLILRGSSSAELTAFCGDPVQISRSSSYGGRDERAGREGDISSSSGDTDAQIWTYNFGPNQLMQRVRIENGTVVQIDDLGYGFDAP